MKLFKSLIIMSAIILAVVACRHSRMISRAPHVEIPVFTESPATINDSSGVSQSVSLLSETVIWEHNSNNKGSNLKLSSKESFNLTKEDLTKSEMEFFPAKLKRGDIGAIDNKIADRPGDNVFVVDISDVENIKEAYLSYDLYGVKGSSSVSRSINQGHSIGGAFVIRDTVWRHQKEAISPGSLKEGANIVKFSSPADASYGYTVQNVGIYTVKGPSFSKPGIIINKNSTSYYNNKAYISGYINGLDDNEVQRLTANGQELFYKAGEFFGIIGRPDSIMQTHWDVSVQLQVVDGLSIQEQIRFSPGERAAVHNSMNKIDFAAFEIDSGHTFNLELGGAMLFGGEHAACKDTIVEISTLRGIDVMPTQTGLVNVTGRHAAYRMLPHGLEFCDPVIISLPYDSTLIPPGHKAEDIRTYYFDEMDKSWVALAFDSLDIVNKRVYSYTTHFTDFINGIIEVPESPETAGYTPTSISDLKVVNPVVGISQIAPPTANNRGSAEISYPLNIPAGRLGLMPDLSVNYSSGGGSGWLGESWSIALPSISVDTRWGVPRFSDEFESETYLLSGQQLTPLAHRAEWVKRTSNKQFYPRLEGAFSRIKRMGTSPSNYWWEVTSSGGIRYFYGSSDGKTVDADAVIKDDKGNIGEWKLVKVLDLNGNEVLYSYDKKTYDAAPFKGGHYLYLKNINYTGKDGVKGKYNIDFVLQDKVRKDGNINAKYGCVLSDGYLLDKIKILFDEEVIRSYGFSYKEGAFGKTLLEAIIEYDSKDQEFYKHDFEYYDEVRPAGSGYSPFVDSESLDLGNDGITGTGVLKLSKAPALGATNTVAFGGGLYAGVGLGYNTSSKSNSVGGSYYFNRSTSNGLTTMIDLNGDGLPDKVFVDDNTIWYCAQMKDGTFAKNAELQGASGFMHTKTDTHTGGISATVGPAGVGVSKSTSRSKTETYFSDVNGDGLVDIVSKGKVLYNAFDGTGHPRFTSNLAELNFPTSGAGAINEELLMADEADYNEQLMQSPLQDMVRLWEAPYSGRVKVSGSVRLLVDSIPQDSVGWDGVRVAIQREKDELWSQSITDLNSEAYTPSGLDSISVKKGDRIFFRMQSNVNGMHDFVEWSPAIEYTTLMDTYSPFNILIPIDIDPGLKDLNNKPYFKFDSEDDFLLSWSGNTGFPASGKVNINTHFSKPPTSDNVFIEHYLVDSTKRYTLLSKTEFFLNEVVNNQPISISTIVEGDNHSLYIKVYSNSNVDWNALSFQTDIDYLESYDENISKEELDKLRISSVPHIITYDSLLVDNIKNYKSYTAPKDGRLVLRPSAAMFRMYPGDDYDPFIELRTKDLGGTVNYVLKQKEHEPVVNKVSNFLSNDTIFGGIRMNKGETVDIESFTENSLAFKRVMGDYTLSFITSDTLLLDSIKVLTIKEDTVASEHLELHRRRLSEDVIIDSVFVYNAQGALIEETGKKHDRSTLAYFDYFAEALPRTDSIFNATDTIVRTIVSRTDDYQYYTYEYDTTFVVKHYAHRQYNEFGNGYKGWGQFSYSNIDLESANKPIDTDLLVITENKTKDFNNNNLDFDVDENADYDSNAGGIEEASGVKESNALVAMYPDNHLNGWIGADSTIYLTSALMRSSRKGDKELVKLEDYQAIARRSSGNRGVVKKAKSVATVYNLGASMVLIGGSLAQTTGESTMQSDFMDMNGDGYPDIISNGKIQYSTPLGSLSDFTSSINGDVNSSNSKSKGLSLNGAVPAYFSMSKRVGRGSLSGPSTSMSSSSDSDEYTFFDINGDGLPDKVYKSGMVQLNLGYSFGGEVKWFDGVGVREVDVQDFTVPLEFLSINPTTGEVEGASVAFSNANGSFTAGMGVGVSKSHANVQYLDVNGDGLPDRVETTTGDKPKTRVMLNTGSGFTGIAEGFSWGGTVQRQHNINANTNAAFTFGFTVGPWPVKIVFNPSVELSQSFSRTVEQLMDLDGDGYPDFVTSASSGELKVNYSNIGKTNILKKVNLPLGAYFTLDYEQTENSYEMPNRQWVLTAVEMNDMHPGDGADITRSEFAYGKGFYDRYERTFYGFDKVVSKQIDTENENAVYRSEEQLFENKSYYTQSMMYQSTVSDGAGLIYMQTKNDFAYRAIENPGSDATVKTITADDLSDYCKGTLSIFPHLKSTVNYYYEGATEAGKSYYKEFDYDSKGNISEYRNFGDRENGDKTIYGTVVYHQNSDKYIYNIPEEIVVKSEGKQYRQRKTVINDKGQITRVQHFIDQGDYAEVELQYNDYGNISKKILPPNYKDERMFFEYEYDKQVFSYPVKVSDAFGYSSSTEYDFKYGVPVLSTDMNNNNMRFEYDEKGRLTRVIGPKELASGAPFTIEHEYAHDALPAYGITRHFDVANPGDYIETAIFTDPLGRVLQTKRDATILVNDNLSVVNKEEPQFADVMIVSGKVIYDAFGRVTETYYPTTEALGAIATFNSSVDAVDPTTMTYDVLDRELVSTLPDGSIIKNEYGFGEDRDGVKQFTATFTDALENSTTQYTTARGWQTATLMPDDIWLSTIYDDIGQVVEVRDHDDNITYNDYDALGRRLQRKHPDAGITKWAYDKTGNVLSFHPEHIENPIEYEYEYSRLTKVKYPNNPHNNVSYEYGAPGAENNGAGRLVKQIDGTGAQLFAYGDMGELTRNLRTVVVPDKGKYSFLTVWEYDSWNRLTAMYYPDGEELSYEYNSGGQMIAMKGKKGANNYQYVKSIGYDKFGNRQYIAYGNGTLTSYNYDAQNLRMRALQTTTANGRLIQNNSYIYDAVGNILSLTNNADAVTEEHLYGGATMSSYAYDNRYRLINAEGSFTGRDKEHKYSMAMEYGNTGSILRKRQSNKFRKIATDASGTVEGDWLVDAETSMDYTYSYKGQKPHAVSFIEDADTQTLFTYSYDASGNNLLETNSKASSDREIVWTEDNRMAAIKARGNVSHYIYDANGIRTLKMSSSSFNISVNGVATGTTGIDGNFTVYANPYTVVRENQCTKHFFLGSQRILTKISSNDVEDTFYEGNAKGTVGGVDYGAKQTALESSVDLNTGKLNIGWYRNTHGEVPSAYIKHYLRSKEYGGLSGQNPWGDNGSGGDDSDDNVVSPSYEEKQYYFHPDHLGSSNYLSDVLGEAYQHVEYLPWGETFFEERNTQTDRNPYLYTGKELDLMTGLYYYEQRYFDPNKSTFLGVDPLAEKALSWTPYRYSFNNPITFVDPNGLFETKSEAKQWAKDNNIRTGWFSRHIVEQGANGAWEINNRKEGLSYFRDSSLDGVDVVGRREDGVIESALAVGKKRDGGVNSIDSGVDAISGASAPFPLMPQEGYVWEEGMPSLFTNGETTLVVSSGTGEYIDLMSKQLEREFNCKHKEVINYKGGPYMGPISDTRIVDAFLAGFASASNPVPNVLPVEVPNDIDKGWRNASERLKASRIKWYRRYDVIMP